MGFEPYQVTESGLDGSPDTLAATAGFVLMVDGSVFASAK
jgi:hypothetical protein